MEQNERDYIKVYQNKGYINEYRMIDGKLTDIETKKEYSPKDIYIVAEHRFEGMSNPSDLSILYIFETNDLFKGNVLAGYGPSNESALSQFFSDIPKEQFSNEKNVDYCENEG
ncbi:hypothetical protein [Aureibaculum luteum]|uniref:hypothetical protein n=1 Tax=Aureibaculum luteum TaxID=1548456 RepID=UPI000E4A2D0C|nr:hypothetical protein [Aureibaculum luteum]